MKIRSLLISLIGALWLVAVSAQPALKPNPEFDAEAAKRLGADAMGMRYYVLAILKTGPKQMAPGKERDAMFAGHFANISRMANEGKLAVAGPADNVDGWRGIYLFAVKDIEEARQLTATDPVIVNGEMVAEYHKIYASAALMDIPQLHKKTAEKVF